jgi:20S proteasome alpha/beta subunit
MTIALGFLCADGIVLGVDSQYSGGASKTSGQKIFPIQQNERFSVTLATAGHVGIAKRAVQKFTSALIKRVGVNSASLTEMQDILEDVLCEIHAKHVYSAPADERATVDFWMLMAVWTPTEIGLFRTDVTAVTRVQERACIGVGSYLGDYLMDLLCHYAPVMRVEEVKPIVAYVIKCAKGFIEGCGLNTFIRVLSRDGIDERIKAAEIIDGEECYESIFRSMRNLLSPPPATSRTSAASSDGTAA